MFTRDKKYPHVMSQFKFLNKTLKDNTYRVDYATQPFKDEDRGNHIIEWVSRRSLYANGHEFFGLSFSTCII